MAQPTYPSSNYWTLTLARGPLISRDGAVAIGAVLLREKWEEDHARRQGELTVEDQSDTWRVLGSASEPDGQFCMIIRKADGLVINIGLFGGPFGPPTQ